MHVGIIGAGQLGRMLALAGIPLGIRFSFLDPSDQPCAADLGRVVCAAFDDSDAIRQFAKDCDVLTFEFENIPAKLLSEDNAIDIQPCAKALFAAQDRAREKTLFEHCAIPVGPWRPADNQQEVEKAIDEIGLPVIVKLRSLGYDGKGQTRIIHKEDAANLYEKMGGVGLLVERLIDFDQELSVIGTRDHSGNIAIYPLTKNEHRNGILHRSETTAFNSALTQQAVKHFKALAEKLDYVGTLAIEFFVKDQVLLGNEFAPRVHNSGHWTIDGAPSSQFNNHIRAICGLPLGATTLCRPSGMLNLIGKMPNVSEVTAAHCYFHDYAKSPRAGRKLGHLNIIAETQRQVSETLDEICAQLDL